MYVQVLRVNDRVSEWKGFTSEQRKKGLYVDEKSTELGERE